MRKVNYLLIGIIFTIFLFSFDTTKAAAPTLASQIAGNFKGMLRNPSGIFNDYEIVIAEVNATRVSIAPASTSNSATFEVDLESQVIGSVTVITLKAPDDIFENNGTFVPSTGRLSYIYFLGSDDDRNIEVFVGDK